MPKTHNYFACFTLWTLRVLGVALATGLVGLICFVVLKSFHSGDLLPWVCTIVIEAVLFGIFVGIVCGIAWLYDWANENC